MTKTYLFLLLSIANFICGQNSEIDSLKSVLQKHINKPLGLSSNTDTTVIQTLYFIAKFTADEDPREAKIYALKAMNLLDSLHENSKTITDKYYKNKFVTISKALSVITENLGEYDLSIEYLEKSLPYLDSKTETKDIVKWYNSLSYIYSNKGNNKTALDYGFKGLLLSEKNNNDKGICGSLKTIAYIYSIQGKHTLSLPYYERIIKIREKNKDYTYIVDDYNNIANALDELGKSKEALEYLMKALKYSREIKNLRNEAMTLNNLAYFYIDKEQTLKGLDYSLQSSKIRQKIGDYEGQAKSLNTISVCYAKSSNYTESIKVAKEGLLMAKKLGHISMIRDFNQLLYENYSLTNDFKQALDFHIEYIKYKDSLMNLDVANQFNELETKYGTEKKDAENKLLQTENQLSNKTIKQQKIITYFIIGGLLIVSVLAFFIFKGLKKQRKANEIISNQKIIVEHQKHLVEEKHKEITDSINYAERIQRALLANKKILDENLTDYFILFKPKDVVSGDFYWSTTLSNHHFVLVTADSTGHGVPGAIMSIVNIASLKETVIQGITSPDLILNETRRLIINNLKNDGSQEGGKDGMDASLLSFDFKTNTLFCACANNPIWIIRGVELIEIKSDRMPIGKHDKDQTPFTLHTISLQKGDVVYALTDGFPDQFGGKDGKKFKSRQLQEILLSIVQEPMNTQKQKLNAIFESWKGDLEQVDDVTIVGIRI